MTSCHEYCTIEEAAALCGLDIIGKKKLLPLKWGDNYYDKQSRSPLFKNVRDNIMAAWIISAKL